MNKQTSVEWLIEQIDFDANTRCFSQPEWFAIYQKAKAMHKEEMFEYIKQKYCIGQMSLEFHTLEFEQYYNETFGGNYE